MWEVNAEQERLREDFEHADEGRYGACRVVFGATEPTDTEPTDTEPTDTEPTDTEPTDTELLAFVTRRWAALPFDLAADPSQMADAVLAHTNPKRRQREARKLVENSGVGTKAQQAMSASYEVHKAERKTVARETRQAEADRQFVLKQHKRKAKHRGK